MLHDRLQCCHCGKANVIAEGRQRGRERSQEEASVVRGGGSIGGQETQTKLSNPSFLVAGGRHPSDMAVISNHFTHELLPRCCPDTNHCLSHALYPPLISGFSLLCAIVVSCLIFVTSVLLIYTTTHHNQSFVIVQPPGLQRSEKKPQVT